MKNSQRIANLSTFRSDNAKILVTTDLTSRGLDISEVNLVINYDMPRTVADYVHRVGRTARNGLEGEAVTFITPNEVEMFQNIEK
jgi:superfamily II DNA/RNA helicase